MFIKTYKMNILVTLYKTMNKEIVFVGRHRSNSHDHLDEVLSITKKDYSAALRSFTIQLYSCGRTL